MTLKFDKVLEVVEAQVRAKCHEAKCSGSRVINSALDFTSYRVHKLFLPYLAMVKNPKIRFCDFDLRP